MSFAGEAWDRFVHDLRKISTDYITGMVKMPEETFARFDGCGIKLVCYTDGTVEIVDSVSGNMVRLTEDQWDTVREFVQFVQDRVR